MDKKNEQLGMSISTASYKLAKDILFKLAVEAGHKCYRCNLPLTRETFSIEHKVPWLDSESPREMYFDLGNIAFSHHACNSKACRRTRQKFSSTAERMAHWQAHRQYDPSKRKDQYLRTGK